MQTQTKVGIFQNSALPTPSLLVEIFSRFFIRILEKDPNYQTYLKEWNAFKELLLKDPFDVDKIFMHIATLQLNRGRLLRIG